MAAKRRSIDFFRILLRPRITCTARPMARASSSSCRALAYTTSCRSAGELVAPLHLQGAPGLPSHSAPVGVPTAPARLARILLAAGCSAYPVRDVDNSRFARWQGREGPLRYFRPGVLSVNPARRSASAIASPLAGAGLLRPACVSVGWRRLGRSRWVLRSAARAGLHRAASSARSDGVLGRPPTP